MKKLLSINSYIMLGLNVLLPIGFIAVNSFGYSFSLFNYIVFSIFTTVISISAVIMVLLNKNTTSSKVIYAILSPISCINWAFYLIESKSPIVSLCMLICLMCAIFLTLKLAKPFLIKTICLIITALMILPLGFITLVQMTFGSFGKNTVVSTIFSPNGEYYAEIIDSDQGALGGNTIVYVYKNKNFNAYIFTIDKKPKRIYIGEWRQYEDMQIYWKNDNSLIINSKKYKIE